MEDGITPSGQPGVPARFSTGPALTGVGTAHFTNNSPGVFLLQNIDVLEINPSAGDSLEIGLLTTTNWFFATSVGTGHTGGFHDQWTGILPVYWGEQLQVNYVSSGAASWYLTIAGYYLPKVTTVRFDVT